MRAMLASQMSPAPSSKRTASAPVLIPSWKVPQHDARERVEAACLSLAPQVSVIDRDLVGPLGVFDAAFRQRQPRHRDRVEGTGSSQFLRRWIQLGQVHLSHVGPEHKLHASREPIREREVVIDAGAKQIHLTLR